MLALARGRRGAAAQGCDCKRRCDGTDGGFDPYSRE